LGNFLWCKSYESGTDGDGSYLIQASDSSLLITGRYSDFDSTSFFERPFLLKIDSVGNILWSRRYDIYGYALTSCLRETFDGGFAISTSLPNQFGNGNFDCGFIKTDNEGYTFGCAVSEPIYN